eukprot:1525939-Rhodomonas_salina.2
MAGRSPLAGQSAIPPASPWSSDRFSYLLLDHDEYYFRRFEAVAIMPEALEPVSHKTPNPEAAAQDAPHNHRSDPDAPPAQRKCARGILHICGSGILFEPQELDLPVLRIPFRKVTRFTTWNTTEEEEKVLEENGARGQQAFAPTRSPPGQKQSKSSPSSYCLPHPVFPHPTDTCYSYCRARSLQHAPSHLPARPTASFHRPYTNSSGLNSSKAAWLFGSLLGSPDARGKKEPSGEEWGLMPSWWEHCVVHSALAVAMKRGGGSARYEKLAPVGHFSFALRQRGHLDAEERTAMELVSVLLSIAAQQNPRQAETLLQVPRYVPARFEEAGACRLLARCVLCFLS